MRWPNVSNKNYIKENVNYRIQLMYNFYFKKLKKWKWISTKWHIYPQVIREGQMG